MFFVIWISAEFQQVAKGVSLTRNSCTNAKDRTNHHETFPAQFLKYIHVDTAKHCTPSEGT